jgi:hypothetical protein
MTTHYELIDIAFLKTFTSRKYAQLVYIMADPTQISGVSGGYVDNGMVSFHILNRD